MWWMKCHGQSFQSIRPHSIIHTLIISASKVYIVRYALFFSYIFFLLIFLRNGTVISRRPMCLNSPKADPSDILDRFYSFFPYISFFLKKKFGLNDTISICRCLTFLLGLRCSFINICHSWIIIWISLSVKGFNMRIFFFQD